MPIDASPSGTLDIENATLRSREIVALTNMVAGNDVVRADGPALEVYGDPGPRLELVSNTAATDGTATFTRLESNVGVFSIQSGTDAATNGPITFGGFQNERMRIDADGKVGIGTNNPGAPFEVHGADLTGQPAGTTGILSRHVAGEDGVLNIFGVQAPNGEEKVGLQTQIDGRAWQSDIDGGWSYGGDDRHVLSLQPYKGRVGIGKTTPNCTLDINDSTSQFNGIFSKRLWLSSVGDNSGNGTPDDNTGSPWRGLGFDNLAWNDQSHKYSGDIPILSGYDGVALRSGAGNLVLTVAGDVGIGVTNPGAKMDIFTGSTGVAGLSLDRFESGNYRTDIYQNTYGLDFRVGYAANTPESVLYLKRFSDGSKEVEINGNVGIGTTSPEYKLHVEDGSNPRIMLENTDTILDLNQDIGSILFKQNDSTAGTATGIIGKIRMSSVIAPPAGTFYGESANMIFSVGNYANNNANIDALTIRGNGNVGIGNANPGNKLDVNGGISTSGITSTGGFVTTTGIQISMASGTWYNVVDFRSYRYAWKRMFIAGYRYGYNLTGNATFFVTTDTGNWYATLTQEYNYAGVEFRVSGNYIQARQLWYLGNTESLIFRIVSLT